MPHDCLITYRLAGPCACCRQAAWPAHVWPDGRILCADCCACAPRDAAPAGAAARSMPREQSGPARGMPEKRATGACIAPAGPGKARVPPRPFRAILGRWRPYAGHPASRPARRCCRLHATAPHAAHMPALPPEACRPARDLATRALPARGRDPAGRLTLPAALAGLRGDAEGFEQAREAARGWRCRPQHAARPDAPQAEDLATMPPAGLPRRGKPNLRRTSRQKHFSAGMFRLQSHLEAEQ